MATLALASHLAFAFVLFAISAVVTWLMLRVRMLDVPNHRSSHETPVPNSGGIAISLTILIGFSAAYFLSDETRVPERYMLGFGLAALAVVVVGLLDDTGRLHTFKVKLGIQIAAAAILLVFGVVIRKVSLPIVGNIDFGWWGYPITLMWVVGLTNAFNFMDGLDGLAGGTGVVVAGFFGVITFLQGSLFVYILCYVLLSSALGFMIFNFPKARIFMGDAGSQLLGFSFAALAVMAAEYDASRTSLWVMPLLFFNFIYDTSFTFFRRVLAREQVTQAHRSHLYQLFNQLGYSHASVSMFHFSVAGLQGLGALWLISLETPDRALVFLPFLAFQIAYTIVVVRAARKRHLI